MSNAFTDYVDALEMKYPPEMFLGHLLWFTVTEDTQVQHHEFVKAIISGLDDMVDVKLPPAPRTVDIFKRACTNAQRRNQRAIGDDHTSTNYNVKHVTTTKSELIRILQRERIDSEGQKLEAQSLVKVRFLRGTDKIEFSAIEADWDDDAVAVEVTQDIETYFHGHAGVLTAYAIRKYIRDLLFRQVYGISVRSSGGVYFVLNKYADVIHTLAGIISTLPGNSDFHVMPLVDDTQQRGMLKAAFEDDSIGEVDKMLGEISEILGKDDGRISTSDYAEYKGSFDVIKGRVLEYSELLDESLEATASRLEIANDILFELLGRVK